MTVQAKDIDTDTIMAVIEALWAEPWLPPKRYGTMRALHMHLSGHTESTPSNSTSYRKIAQQMPDFPAKVVLAKLRRLDKQGRIYMHCTCGCGSPIVPPEQETP